MQRNDISRAQNLEQLKQQYDLSNNDLKTAIKTQSGALTKVENSVNNLIDSIVINLSSLLESQSEISLWFFDGTPTLENNPYVSWVTPSDHIGDFYYDRSSGYVYQYTSTGWIQNSDEELIKSMALTNASIDTTDNERKVFFDTPIPAYSNGDWWIKSNGILWICKIAKTSGTFEDMDFIISNQYEDNLAIKTSNKFIVLSGQVTVIQYNVDSIESTVSDLTTVVETDTTAISNNYQELNNKFNDYTPKNRTLELENSVTEIQTSTYTKTEINTKLTDGSVTKVVSTNFTYDENGMSESKTDAKADIFLGFKIINGYNKEGLLLTDKTGNIDNELLFAGYDEETDSTVVRAEKFIAKNHFIVGTNSRFENYTDSNSVENRTGCFYIGE